jgi:hypothetical protein
LIVLEVDGKGVERDEDKIQGSNTSNNLPGLRFRSSSGFGVDFLCHFNNLD